METIYYYVIAILVIGLALGLGLGLGLKKDDKENEGPFQVYGRFTNRNFPDQATYMYDENKWLYPLYKDEQVARKKFGNTGYHPHKFLGCDKMYYMDNSIKEHGSDTKSSMYPVDTCDGKLPGTTSSSSYSSSSSSSSTNSYYE